MAIDDDPVHRSGGRASGRAPAGGMEMVALPDLRFDLLCDMARRMFGVSVAAIRVRGTGKIWHAGEAGPPAEHERPLSSVPFGIGGIGRFSLYGDPAKVLGVNELRLFRQLAALAGEQLWLFDLVQEALRRENDFRLLAESSTDTIIRGNLDGVRLYVSPSIRDLLGYAPGELVGRRAIELTHPDDVPPFKALMQEVRAGRLDIGRTEQRQRHKDGSWVWLEASIRLTYDPDTGAPDGYVSSARDIGHRKRLEAQLKHLAEVDDLTGLPNRAFFSASLDRAIKQAGREGGGFALFYMDLDGFKQINDTYGHAAGDDVLRETAARLQASLRGSDHVFRLGGDEFTVLSNGHDRMDMNALAQRLIAAVSRPFLVEGTDIDSIGLSIGIACWPQHARDAEQLLECADRALYRAKKAGKNTARLHDDDSRS